MQLKDYFTHFLTSFFLFCIFIFIKWLFCLHVYMFTMCVSGPYGGQKRTTDSLDQDYKQLRFTVGELGTEPLPFARAAISPALVWSSYHFPRCTHATVYIARPDINIYFRLFITMKYTSVSNFVRNIFADSLCLSVSLTSSNLTWSHTSKWPHDSLGL